MQPALAALSSCAWTPRWWCPLASRNSCLGDEDEGCNGSCILECVRVTLTGSEPISIMSPYWPEAESRPWPVRVP